MLFASGPREQGNPPGPSEGDLVTEVARQEIQPRRQAWGTTRTSSLALERDEFHEPLAQRVKCCRRIQKPRLLRGGVGRGRARTRGRREIGGQGLRSGVAVCHGKRSQTA